MKSIHTANASVYVAFDFIEYLNEWVIQIKSQNLSNNLIFMIMKYRNNIENILSSIFENIQFKLIYICPG